MAEERMTYFLIAMVAIVGLVTAFMMSSGINPRPTEKFTNPIRAAVQGNISLPEAMKIIREDLGDKNLAGQVSRQKICDIYFCRIMYYFNEKKYDMYNAYMAAWDYWDCWHTEPSFDCDKYI